MAAETVRRRVRNVANAVLVSGQAYQEQRDARSRASREVDALGSERIPQAIRRI